MTRAGGVSKGAASTSGPCRVEPVDPIYLRSYDYYEDNGVHFDAYDPTRNANSVYDYSMECIERISRERWIPRIFNCNPRSALTCFPHVSIESFLSE